jgi:HSP20 family molecular chaperone IbpA
MDADYQEISHVFACSFRLPGDASSDNISASVKDGVLTVTVPKREPPDVQHKEVPVS